MAINACKLLLEVDGYFKNENVDEEKFNKNNSLVYRCPYEDRKLRPCENNYERINALGVYLYEKLGKIANDLKGKGNNDNRHIEIFIMWLSDKLYKLEENKIRTLDQFYEKHLKDYTGNFKYWNVIDSRKVYKGANTWYLSELYSLLNDICSIVIEYNKNKNKNKNKIEKASSQCHKKFKNIYNNVKDCYSYVHLLKYLKNIYDVIRNDAIKEIAAKKDDIKKKIHTNNDIKRALSLHKNDSRQVLEYVLDASTISLMDLTTSDWNQIFLDESDQIIDFHTQKCVELYSKTVKKQEEHESKIPPKAEPQAGSDQSGKEGNKEPSDPSKGAQNKDGDNSHTQKQQQASTSLPADQQSVSEPLPSAPALGNGQEGSDKSPKASSNGQADSGNIKLQNILNNAKNTFELYSSTFYGTYTDIRKRLNESMMSALENAHTNSTYIANKVNSAIMQVSEQLQKHSTSSKEQKPQSDHKQSEPKTPSSSSTCPSSADPPTPNSQQTNPPINGPLNDKKSVSTYSSNIVTNSVTDTKIKESTQKAIIIGNIFKGEASTYVKVIAILIPIILGIMYKCLSSGWRKELKRKKSMKKVINSIGGKKTTQIIINSSTKKKQSKKFITSVYRKNFPLLNIYTLMEADPVPFINLFFLLIFCVYKRKLNYFEL
ncbi:CIR protein [Plasmodium chabaudi chabaudi]|uniref:CIR protein n=1 Tax=Plasmodium chabaudi chabaudi TaxID=31271 RepID=A0A4V0K370_PLACU|nr:CIR protein [Plasmodium chabaudi chabaudi]VTZ67335.1 CIR protein [Plasmodium chabaudi chabaudi]|eukprot:XP_016653360.1 CIR protein [Plasmodium chabaudi chabaudi]